MTPMHELKQYLVIFSGNSTVIGEYLASFDKVSEGITYVTTHYKNRPWFMIERDTISTVVSSNDYVGDIQ